MPIRLVTLDCANTLLRGSWEPVEFALWSAREAGLCLPSRAGAAYADLLRRRYPAILAANRTGDYGAVQAEYVRLGEEWLSGLGVDPGLAPSVVEASEALLTSASSGLFEPFDDTIPFLVDARARGLRLAVVSNWDASLAMVLKAHGIDSLVDEAFASLVVGAEKPNPAMIHLAVRSAGVGPSETLHIGDDPIDDLGAAENAGVRGLLIDRKSPGCRDGRTISSLQEAFEWIG